MKPVLRLLSCLVSLILPARAQLSFSFDYSYDTAGFFSGENVQRRTYLETAGAYLTDLISATPMAAITPSGADAWLPVVFDPADYTQSISLGNISVPANTINVYAGGMSFTSPSTVAYGGPGGGSVPDGVSMEWISTLLYRGNDTYRMPPIGTITFSTDWDWYFDDDISTVEPFGDDVDFFSEALHELIHVLGFGTLETWTQLVDSTSGTFLGPQASATYGATVPLDGLQQHWANGTMSFITGTTIVQETAMDPSIFLGARKYATELDLAALADLGYTATSPSAVPEPATTAAILGLCVLATLLRRRRPDPL